MTGTVKWFSQVKGFGFIVPDAGAMPGADDGAAGPDAFVHHTDIVMDGYRTLAPGQRVAFEGMDEGKGLKERSVRAVPE